MKGYFPGMRVALVVNNLGGTSNLELYIMANSAIRYLGEIPSTATLIPAPIHYHPHTCSHALPTSYLLPCTANLIPAPMHCQPEVVLESRAIAP